ncbi:MAG: hypothetical protein MJZ99_06790 [Bacteroidales bacterium]|nr:hypothetical protein [Candidatus Colimorpha merdihippi]MCQ2282314.1 hypothetical protein [Bacteroidales bacterium]
MKNKIVLLTLFLLCAASFTGCTKRCRCIQYNSNVVYYSKEEVAARHKTCQEMQYIEGMHTQYYSYCEWVYGD